MASAHTSLYRLDVRLRFATGFLVVAASVMLAPQDVASAPPAAPPITPALMRSRVSLSVGAPNAGRLLRGTKLSPSERVRIVPAWSHPDTRWGLPQLIGMVERAAKKVHEVHGSGKISIGDISSRRGGTLRKHRSHQSGRDVDIAFYIVNRRGKPIYHDRFIKVGANGHAHGLPNARFDDARNWTLVEAMLHDPHARVQRIFVSNAIRQRLLEEAERQKVPRHLRLLAARVMMQSKGSSAHADHFHVRIHCPKNQRGACENYVRKPSKLQAHTQTSASKSAKVRRGKRRRTGSDG